MGNEVKLTKAQRYVMDKMAEARHRARFEKLENQEAVCQLDALGLCTAYTDAGNSLGIVWGSITPAGRATLEANRE
jgi:hypothetical protein